MCHFFRFACNQDTVDLSGEENAIPPLPMKIAPPVDEDGDQDNMMIRVETCMFLIKLPFYSSFEVMDMRLRQAVMTRFDPLIG